MTRLSYVQRDDAEPRLHPIYDAVDRYGPFGNQTKTMAHCPPVLEHVMALLIALKEEGRLSRRHVELLNVTVAKLNQCDYCFAHHAPALEIEGMSDDGIARLPDYDEHPELDEIDQLVVGYAVQVNNAPEHITDGFFDRLRAHFSEAEIAELTWRIGLAGAFNRINQALDIDTESDLIQLGTANLHRDGGG